MTSKMPRPRKADPLAHGEKKSPKQFVLTPTADGLIEAAVELTGLSRSEILERAIRGGAMDLVVFGEPLKKP